MRALWRLPKLSGLPNNITLAPPIKLVPMLDTPQSLRLGEESSRVLNKILSITASFDGRRRSIDAFQLVCNMTLHAQLRTASFDGSYRGCNDRGGYNSAILLKAVRILFG